MAGDSVTIGGGRRLLAFLVLSALLSCLLRVTDSAPLLSGNVENIPGGQAPVDQFGLLQGSLAQAHCLARCFNIDPLVRREGRKGDNNLDVGSVRKGDTG